MRVEVEWTNKPTEYAEWAGSFYIDLPALPAVGEILRIGHAPRGIDFEVTARTYAFAAGMARISLAVRGVKRQEPAPEPAKPGQVTMVCRDCGSPAVEAHATAKWDPHKREWKLVDTLDYGTCPDCGNANVLVVEGRAPA